LKVVTPAGRTTAATPASARSVAATGAVGTKTMQCGAAPFTEQPKVQLDTSTPDPPALHTESVLASVQVAVPGVQTEFDEALGDAGCSGGRPHDASATSAETRPKVRERVATSDMDFSVPRDVPAVAEATRRARAQSFCGR